MSSDNNINLDILAEVSKNLAKGLFPYVFKDAVPNNKPNIKDQQQKRLKKYQLAEDDVLLEDNLDDLSNEEIENIKVKNKPQTIQVNNDEQLDEDEVIYNSNNTSQSENTSKIKEQHSLDNSKRRISRRLAKQNILLQEQDNNQSNPSHISNNNESIQIPIHYNRKYDYEQQASQSIDSQQSTASTVKNNTLESNYQINNFISNTNNNLKPRKVVDNTLKNLVLREKYVPKTLGKITK
ncbi:hypothetical protein ACFX5K_00465 [Rickettsiales bacterium LUAb2]